MDEKALQQLMRDYAVHQPDDQVFSDQERAQIRAELREREAEKAPFFRSSTNAWLRRPVLFVYGTIATAAMIGLVLMMPTEQSQGLQMEVIVGRSLERSSSREKRFEVTVSTETSIWVQLVVLDESGALTVLRTNDDSGKRIDGAGSLGSYKLAYALPNSDLHLRTYAVVLGSTEPVTIDRVAETIPDQLDVTPGDAVAQALDELCENLTSSLIDHCVFKSITEE
jgi:hypothetical protein